MNPLFHWINCGHSIAMDIFKKIDWVGPLAIRLYLFPIFLMAGMNKLNNFSDIVSWFEYGLGLPLPTLLAFLATAAEVVGAWCLLFGVGVRYMAVPLTITMIVAATTVHLEYGWQSVADPNGLFVNERVAASAEKLERARAILQEHGNYDWLTSSGKFVVLNNGIEWAITYLIMCLSLMATGAGRWVSVDYWVKEKIWPGLMAKHSTQ